MYEVRVKYFPDSSKHNPFLTITFSKIYKDQFFNKRIGFCKKGSRLYLKEDPKGLKCTNVGVVNVTKGAQDYRQFEGEYDLKVDRITERYYIDLQMARPLDEPVNENNDKVTIMTNEEYVINYISNLVIEMVKDSNPDDIITLVKAMEIIRRKQNDKY